MCKPFSSPSTPSLCPCLMALGMGAVGPSPLGLRVSSRSLWFSHYPPSKVPCPLPSLPPPPSTPISRQPTVPSGTGAPSWCRSTAPSLQRGFPWQALLPLTWPTPPIWTVLSTVRDAVVMCTGYRVSNRTQVVAAFTPSANFIFCIYRDLDPPYGAALLHVAPPYTHYSPPPHPVFLPLSSPSAGLHGPSLQACPAGDCFFSA